MRESSDLSALGSVLAGVLLPGIGRPVTEEELAPGRWLEYVVAENVTRSLPTFTLSISMLFAESVALRRRVAGGGGAIPILLVPDWSRTVKITLVGIDKSAPEMHIDLHEDYTDC